MRLLQIYVVRDSGTERVRQGLRNVLPMIRDVGRFDLLFLRALSEKKGEEAWVLLPNADDRYLVDWLRYRDGKSRRQT